MSDHNLLVSYMAGVEDGKRSVKTDAVLSEVRADIDNILKSEIEIANRGNKSTARLVALARIIEKIDHYILSGEHFR